MNEQSIEAIVVEYRSPDRTIKCIYSLLEHSVSRVFVIDNSSDSGETLSTLKEQFSLESRVSIIDATFNRGFAAAVNIGILLSTTSFVLIINNDAVLERGAIEALRKSLVEKRKAVASFPTLIHSGRTLHRIFYHTWLTTITGIKLPGSYEVPRGCCMLIARERLNQAQLFDERFFMYGEELELGWRYRNIPDAFVLAKDARVIHEGSASSVHGSTFYEERTALAHILISRILSTPGFVGTARYAIRLLIVFLRAGLRSIRQRSTVPFHSLRKAIHHASGQKSQLSNPPSIKKD